MQISRRQYSSEEWQQCLRTIKECQSTASRDIKAVVMPLVPTLSSKCTCTSINTSSISTTKIAFDDNDHHENITEQQISSINTTEEAIKNYCDVSDNKTCFQTAEFIMPVNPPNGSNNITSIDPVSPIDQSCVVTSETGSDTKPDLTETSNTVSNLDTLSNHNLWNKANKGPKKTESNLSKLSSNVEAFNESSLDKKTKKCNMQ